MSVYTLCMLHQPVLDNPCLGGWQGVGPTLEMWFYYTCPPLAVSGRGGG